MRKNSIGMKTIRKIFYTKSKNNIGCFFEQIYKYSKYPNNFTVNVYFRATVLYALPVNDFEKSTLRARIIESVSSRPAVSYAECMAS